MEVFFDRCSNLAKNAAPHESTVNSSRNEGLGPGITIKKPLKNGEITLLTRTQKTCVFWMPGYSIFGCFWAHFRSQKAINNRVKFWMCFRSRFWIFLGSIFDQSLVLENRYFFEKMLNFGSKNGGKLGSQKAPQKSYSPGPFRDPPDLGRSWPPLAPPRRLLGLIWRLLGPIW